MVERGANCVFWWGCIARELFVVSAFQDFSYETDIRRRIWENVHTMGGGHTHKVGVLTRECDAVPFFCPRILSSKLGDQK